MSRPALTVVALIALATFATLGTLRTSAREGRPKTLPGARPEVDASQFESLQAAIDALPAEGGVIRLPAGHFEIAEPLVVWQEDVLLTGAGTATHIENASTNGKAALIIRPKGGTDDSDDRQWRIHLADLRITGNDQSGPGLLADHVNEIYLEGLDVSHNGGDGIVLDHCYEDPRVCDCLITYNKGTGLNLLGCHDIVVNGCQFEENQDALHCFDGFNLCMTGNCLDDHLGHGVVIENTYGSVVSGNMIEECKGTAIVLDRDCYGITLSANVIAHDGAGIDLKDAHGCAVSANTFTIMHSHALRIGPDSGRITVTGNNFSNSYIGGGKVKRGTNDRDAAGMTLDATSNVAVSGNLFSGLKPKAVQLDSDDNERVLFAGNVLVDNPSDHRELENSVVGHNLDAE